VPEELADSYSVKVKMEGGPFKIDENAESMIPKSSIIPESQLGARAGLLQRFVEALGFGD